MDASCSGRQRRLAQLLHQQAGALLEELDTIEAEVLQLTALVEVPHG
jgi:hypothetical protein